MRIVGNSRRLTVRAGVLAVALGLLFFGSGRGDILPEGTRVAAPNFSLIDSNGNSISLADLKGKTVIVNFWATWCHGCQTEIPWFVEFQKKYGAAGLAVVGISMDEDGWKSVRPYLKARRLNYPIVVGNVDLGHAYRLAAMPKTVLVDREGRVAATYDGVVAKNGFEHDLRELFGMAAKSGKSETSPKSGR